MANDPHIEVHGIGDHNWVAADPETLVAQFQWLVAHSGERGSARRVVLGIRHADGIEHVYPFDTNAARSLGEELIRRSDAEDPPQTPSGDPELN